MPRTKTKYEKELEEELKRIQETMIDLETYIQEFGAFLPLPVCSINPLGIIIDTNQAFQKLTKYSASEIVGASVETIFQKKKDITTLLKEVFEKKEVRTQEMVLVAKQKNKIPVTVSISVRQDREGEVIGHFIAITDITEPKKLQEELERKVEERTKDLQEKIEELEKFYKLAVGRELKMVELKEKIRELEEELNKESLQENA